MNIKDVIEKVRKLRALATSSNVNEAANAAAAADKLIQEYRLQEAQLESEGHAANEKPEEDGEPLFFGARVQGWRWRLASLLARHYDVACYSSWMRDARGNNSRTLHMIGRKSDIETSRYQIAYFAIEIDRLAGATMKGRGKRGANAFRLGAVQGVYNAMYEAKRATQQAAPINSQGSSAAMVLADRSKESRAEMAKRHPDLRRGGGPNISAASDGDAYNAGERAGRGLGARDGRSKLEGGGTRQLGGGS